MRYFLMKLYHYVHCPYCIRVRMGLGALKLSYESIVLAYDDESTPNRLTGKKMLPIVDYGNGKIQNESLDILKSVDTQDTLSWGLLGQNTEIETLLTLLSDPVHSLCMPYWVWTPEFNPQSRKYFQTKKELKRGSFKNLIKNKEMHLAKLESLINLEIEPHLIAFYKSPKFTILDIMLAAQLWGMYVFPEFQFSEKVHQYLQNIKIITQFDYHQDFWQ